MELGVSTRWWTAVAVASVLLLGLATLVSADPRSACPPNLSGIQSDSDPFIEINFKLYFGCEDSPIYIDQGVRLEYRWLLSDSPNNTDWYPIKYYTPSVEATVNYTSLVTLNASNTSVTATASNYRSSLPLQNVNSNQSYPIYEYICGQSVEITEAIRLGYVGLELRWMQRFGRLASTDNEASWIIDDINITIWNRECVLQVLNEDIIERQLYTTMLGEVRDNPCDSSDNDSFVFSGVARDQFISRRSINLKIETAESCGDQGIKFALDLLKGGVSLIKLEILLERFGEPLPQEISEIVISAARRDLAGISRETDPYGGRRVLEFLDIFGLRGYNTSQGKVSNDDFTFVVKSITREDYTNLEDKLEELNEFEGKLSIPGELHSIYAMDGNEVRVASFIFSNLSEILPQDVDEDGTIKQYRLVSPVVSSTLGCMGISCRSSDIELNNSVLIEIYHSNISTDNEVFGCFFFDLETNMWSSRGCNRSSISNSSFSVCECNHLTHFGILLSPGVMFSKEDELRLEIISYVGVSFSVICMIATIFAFSFLKSLWGMRTYIHINLCVCLIISQVIFVSAVDQTKQQRLCQAIAILLHYFFLTTFMWMLMEGVVLYIVLVCVFIKRQYLYMIGFTVVSYGLPALYVFCVTVPLGLIIKDDQGRPQYGSSNKSDACWLRYDTHFIWAFITPVLVIIIANIGFLSMAISIMWKHKKKDNTENSKINAIYWLRTIISLMVIMGITWSIGILVFHEKLIFVAYIFAIAISFQGTFIFILFVVVSKQVRDKYKSWWRSKKSESGFLTKLFSSPMMGRWSKSLKESRSYSYPVTKERLPQTQTNVMDKNGATDARLISMADRNEKMCTFEGTTDKVYVELSNASSNSEIEENGHYPKKGIGNLSTSKDNDHTTLIENHVNSDRSCDVMMQAM